MRLECRALHWLMYTRRCHFVVRERHPRYGCGEPDALGVTAGRKLIEVEVKRSVSDFRANADKLHVKTQEGNEHKWPLEFWFMVPDNLAAKVAALLPPYAGLLTDGDWYAKVVVQAPKNKASKRLSLKECVGMARCMSNHLCAVERGFGNSLGHWEKAVGYPAVEYEI